MRAIATIMLLTLLGGAIRSNADVIISWHWPGNMSCGEYLESLEVAKRHGTGSAKEFDAFVGGFLTAANRFIPNTASISGDKSFNEIKHYLKEYCRNNVFDDFYLAVNQLVNDLYPHREKRVE